MPVFALRCCASRRLPLEVGVPTLLHVGPYRFLFHSREHDPPHVHVTSPGARAVAILEPMSLLRAKGYTARQRHEIERLVLVNQAEFLRRWHEHFDR